MRNQIKSNSIILLFSLLFCGIFLTLTSCENFLNGKQVKDEILDAIAYNNAKEVSVLVQSHEGSGSTVPAGNFVAKKGYEFEVSFTEASGYSFVKWIAVDKDDSEKIITDGVVFTNEKSPKTKVKITNDSIPLRLIPLCTDRIAVYGEPTPRYDSAGVGRDRSIEVDFTKELSPESFIFDSTELPQGAVPKTDSDGNIWAYTYESQTYFKNISIISSEGLSLAQYFNKPQVSGKNLIITADKDNPIPFETGEISKIVVVTISKNVFDKDGVTSSTEKTWRYLILEASDDKATINFMALSTEGSINAVSKAYSVGQTIGLTFTENADYQFIKWEYDSSIVRINEPQNPNTKVIVREKTTEANPTQVKAVCAPRPRVIENGFSPVTGGTTASVSKNTPIQITFTQNLPDDEAGRAQLENISIAIAGNPVKSSFLTPSITGGTVTFNADPLNMLDVPVNQTKTVTVSIPADFYYELEDEAHTKIYYGGNGKSFNYKINETTNEKAIITFGTSDNGSGTITKGPRQDNTYSLGERIDITFAMDENFQFNGWKIYDADDNEILPTANGTAPVTIDKPSALTTTLNVNAEVQGIKVVADASMKLFVTETSPQGHNITRDSDITITFSKPLDNLCTTSDFLNQIKIKLDGINVDSFFTDRTASGNIITIKNTKFLNVAENERKTVSVSVPSSFYYVDRNITINLGKEYTFDYEVTSQTNVTLPAVTSHSPSSTQSVTANTPIVIVFNMDMDTVSSASELFSWDNIRLTYLGQSLDEHFETPVYDSAAKTLTLMPVLIDQSTDNQTSLASYIKNVLHLNSIDLQVSLQNIMVGNLPLKADSNSTFTVRYMGQNENTPPEQSEFFVTREQIALAKHNHTNEFTYASFADFDNDKIHQNATNGTIYIYGTYQDTDTGVKAVVVTEKHTNDTNGIELVENARAPVIYTPQTYSDYFNTDSSGFTTFCIPHQLQCDDGAVYITVDVQDACQNHAPIHTFTAIKKSSISLENVMLTNLRVTNRNQCLVYVEMKKDENYYNNNIKNIKLERIITSTTNSSNIYRFTENFWPKLYASYIAPDDYIIICKYDGKEGELIFNNEEDEKNQYWSCNLDVDSVAGMSVTICVEDFIGNKTQRIYTFPEPKIVGAEIKPVSYSSNPYNFLCFDKSEDVLGYVKITKYSDGNLDIDGRESGIPFDYAFPQGSSFCFQLMYGSKNGLWGEKSRWYTEEDFYNFTYLTDQIELLKEPVVRKSDAEGYVDIVLEIDENVWKSSENPEGFDDVMVSIYSIDGDTKREEKNNWFEKGSSLITVQKKYSEAVSYNIGITVQGLKEGHPTNVSKIYTIAKLNKNTYDNIRPVVGFGLDFNSGLLKGDNQLYYFTVEKNYYETSKLNYAELLINGVEKYRKTGGYSLEIFFPVWEVLERETNSVVINACDELGNSITENLIVKMNAYDDPIIFTKTSDAKWKFADHRGSLQRIQTFYPDTETETSKWEYKNVDQRTSYNPYDFTLPETPTFLKITRMKSADTSTIPRFFYTGTEQNSGTYDLVLPNGNSKSSVAIQSDAPVFVQTLVTNVSYNECKDWTTDEWDFYKKPVDELIMSFSPDSTDENGNVTTLGDHNPKRYTIPVNKIESGQYYCVVAHFANGTTAQSQVWER